MMGIVGRLLIISALVNLGYNVDPLKIQPFSFPSEVILGQRITTMCSTTWSDRQAFIWRRNGLELNSGGNVELRTFADISTIIIDPVTEDDAGNYTCLVTAEGTSDSYTASLNVIVPASWVLVPEDQQVLEGDMLSLTCKASGKPVPHIRWKKNSASGQDTFQDLQHKDGLTVSSNGTIIVKNVQKEDGGYYKCEASNEAGKPIQKTVLVKVIGPPQIQPFSFPKHVTLGQKTSAMCTAVSGVPPYSFTWLKDGKEIHQYSQVSVESIRGFSAILIDPVDLTTSGNFTCILSCPSGSTSYSAFLEVKVPPQWVSEPKDVEVLLGTNVTINCEASGFPVPTVLWKKVSNDGTGGHYIQAQKQTPGKSTLVMEKITNVESGSYVCHISNGVGEDITKEINVRVIDEPKIQPFNFPDHSTSGDKVIVFCAVKSGEPPFTFTWLKDGQGIKDGNNIATNTVQDFTSLVINPVTIDSIGNYTCVVKNQYGISRYTDTLTVEVPPSWIRAPEDSTVILGGHITLSCAASGYPIPTISWRRTGDRSPKEDYHQPIETEKGNLVLTDVGDEAEGYYVCEAKNGIGEGLRRVVYVAVNVRDFATERSCCAVFHLSVDRMRSFRH